LNLEMDADKADAVIRLLRKLVRSAEELEQRQFAIASDLSYLREIVGMRVETDLQGILQSPVQAYALDPAEDFLGLNWYAAEDRDASASAARWSGPGRLSTIHLPVARKVAMVCRLKIGMFAPGVDPSLGVFVDGRFVTTLRESNCVAEFQISPTTVLKPATEIGLLTDSTKRPFDITPTVKDDRWLGFEFYGLEVLPISLSDLSST
jgi:hypothetical protein